MTSRPLRLNLRDLRRGQQPRVIAVGGLHRRAGGDDRHDLADDAELQFDRPERELADGVDDVVALFVGAESRQLNPDRITAGLDDAKRELAALVGDERAWRGGGFVANRDRRTGKDPIGAVDDPPRDGARVLRERRRGRDGQAENEETDE